MFIDPYAQSDHCCQSKVKVHILDLKTTWAEFQKPSQTAAVQGKAELRMLDFKTTPRMYP